MAPIRTQPVLIFLLALAPLGGCAQMPDMFSGFEFPSFFGGKAPPTVDSAGHRLSRGIVIAVRNVKPAPSAVRSPTAQDGPKPKPAQNAGGSALEYRILQDDGTTFVVVTPGGEDDAITPGQRVLVVHGDEPKVMLETPLSNSQGV